MPNANSKDEKKVSAAPAQTLPAKAEKATAGASVAPKPAGPSAEGKPTGEPVQMRRRFVWTCVVTFLSVNFLMFLRFFFPRALFEPSTVFRIGYPSDFALGVSEKFKQQARIWVVREPDRLFVIYARCTHLGCTPDWKAGENKFKCPCHGSGYTPEGINFEGPAPRPMDRTHVEIDAEGQIVVDTSKLYSWDKNKGLANHFNDPGAYIPG
ncbi:MAG TPA: Rieske 2Fe-2S domain-containing protein [Candidatus Acidoferrales bacterium]